MKKERALDIICYAIVLLFVYAALNKLFLFEIYKKDLGRSPLIGSFSHYLIISIPLSELIVSALLITPVTRKIGLWGSLILMTSFTVYVSIIVFGLPNEQWPCTCGGLIRELTWRQHLAFNILYTGLAGIGIWLYNKTELQWNRN